MPRLARLIVTLVAALCLAGAGAGVAYAHDNPGSATSAEHAASSDHATGDKHAPGNKKSGSGKKDGRKGPATKKPASGSSRHGTAKQNTLAGNTTPRTTNGGAVHTPTSGVGPAELGLVAALRTLLTGHLTSPPGQAKGAQAIRNNQSTQAGETGQDGQQPATAPLPVVPAAPLPWPLQSPGIRPFVPVPSGSAVAPGQAQTGTSGAQPRPHPANSHSGTQDVPYQATGASQRPAPALLLGLLAAFGLAMTAMVVGAGHRGRRSSR